METNPAFSSIVVTHRIMAVNKIQFTFPPWKMDLQPEPLHSIDCCSGLLSRLFYNQGYWHCI
jgi:hypothetical protein